MTRMSDKVLGPSLVAAAAFLWGTDAIFRFPIADKVDATFLVFIEHLLGAFVVLALILVRFTKRDRAQLFRLSRREWAAAAFVGIGGSAIATAVYTTSFRYVNPSVAVLLQKLQPVLVVVMAHRLLGERPDKKFYLWAAVALAAGVVLSFPDLDFKLFDEARRTHFKGVFFALIASVLWGASTVAGKILLKRQPYTVATFWRYAFGLGALAVILAVTGGGTGWTAIQDRSVAFPIVYLAFMAGIVPMATYYAGLSRTSASVATFVELLYPVSAVILNTIYLQTPLDSVQLVAGLVLLFAVTRISL